MTRTLSGARARQLRRREHRASRRTPFGPPATRPPDTRVRQTLTDLRKRRGQIDAQIARLERRLARGEA